MELALWMKFYLDFYQAHLAIAMDANQQNEVKCVFSLFTSQDQGNGPDTSEPNILLPRDSKTPSWTLFQSVCLSGHVLYYWGGGGEGGEKGEKKIDPHKFLQFQCQAIIERSWTHNRLQNSWHTLQNFGIFLMNVTPQLKKIPFAKFHPAPFPPPPPQINVVHWCTWDKFVDYWKFRASARTEHKYGHRNAKGRLPEVKF